MIIYPAKNRCISVTNKQKSDNCHYLFLKGKPDLKLLVTQSSG
jgi:hypothetical protein